MNEFLVDDRGAFWSDGIQRTREVKWNIPIKPLILLGVLFCASVILGVLFGLFIIAYGAVGTAGGVFKVLESSIGTNKDLPTLPQYSHSLDHELDMVIEKRDGCAICYPRIAPPPLLGPAREATFEDYLAERGYSSKQSPGPSRTDITESFLSGLTSKPEYKKFRTELLPGNIQATYTEINGKEVVEVADLTGKCHTCYATISASDPPGTEKCRHCRVYYDHYKQCYYDVVTKDRITNEVYADYMRM